MKFGVNTFLFTSPFTNESTGILKMISALGFDGVEISLENVGDFYINFDEVHEDRLY